MVKERKLTFVGVFLPGSVRVHDSFDYYEPGYLSGTALELFNEWRRVGGSHAFLVLLDRLQECPEEVVGMDSGLVLEAVEWLRNHQ